MKSYNQLIKVLNTTALQLKLDIVPIIERQLKLPQTTVRRGIDQGQMTINGKPVSQYEIVVKKYILLKFKGSNIDLSAFFNKAPFDKFIDAVLEELGETDLATLHTSSKKPLCSFVIAYFANLPLDKVIESKSQYFDQILLELEALYKDNFRDLKDTKIPRRKELIEKLVADRTECLQELTGLVVSLTSGFFSNSLYKFLQQYTKIANQGSFQNMIAPLLQNAVYSRSTFDSLIKPIQEAREKIEIDEKFEFFEANKQLYLTYLSLIDVTNDVHKRIFKEIGDYLFDLFKSECQIVEASPAIIEIAPTPRKYNFNNPDRHKYDLYINVKNVGKGLAREVRIQSLMDAFQFEEYAIGLLKPGELREISLRTDVYKGEIDYVMKLRCTWLGSDSVPKSTTSDIQLNIQIGDIPWADLERKKPYTIQEIDEREKLYGRDEILKELEMNILSERIESYKIWGQKRVGKSSIVKTLKTGFNEKEKIIVIWRSIAGLKNVDPIRTLNTLGESLCGEMFEELDRKISNPVQRESFKAIDVPAFDGSLHPLEMYIKKLKRLDNSLKFIFILDEFDRINEEFFLPGNLGDSFSLNIGKGLNSLSYVGFILVGSENMHLLNRQEMNYNNFQGKEVDTFDKKREFESFKNIIISPVSPHISYSLEAIERIYDVTNGNPYFANLICANIFKLCAKLKDNEVDIHTVTEAVSMIVESSQKSHFEHFWADGITDETSVKKEKRADIRRRILVSYSLVYFQAKQFPVKEEIIKNFNRPVGYEIEPYEIENVIVEFFNRKIFTLDSQSMIRIQPRLFEMWLCGPGRTLMIEGVSDLEAMQREKQLEVEHALKDEELQALANTLFFKDAKLKATDFGQYFNQFGGPFEQRRIFKLLDAIFYISKMEIIEFLKKEQRNIFRKSELEIKSGVRSPYRENVEIYTFPDTLKENFEVIELLKVLSLIRPTRHVKDISTNKEAWKQSDADDIVIFESVIDDYGQIHTDLMGLFDDKLSQAKVPVKLVCLVITSKAKADLIKATAHLPNFRFIHFKEIEESKIKPFSDTTELFESKEEVSYVLAETRKHINDTNKDSLAILFETHCPSKAIPILWYAVQHFRPIFPNPDGILRKREEDGEIYRDRVYQANKRLIQALNPFLTTYLKRLAKAAGVDDWFNADFLPRATMEKILKKWGELGAKVPKETLFDLIDYKEIIKKHPELNQLFQLRDKGHMTLNWMDTINDLRREPAHPEKPPPSKDQMLYFERITGEILKKIQDYAAAHS